MTEDDWPEVWACDGCDKKFATELEALEHEQSCPKAWEDYWTCEGCSKNFDKESDALEHEKMCQQYLELKNVIKRKEDTEFEEPEVSVAAIPNLEED
jgi:predicted HNH restriction endonuclease